MANERADFAVYTAQAIATTQFDLHKALLREALEDLLRATDPLPIISAFTNLSTRILQVRLDIGPDALQPSMKTFLCFFLEQASKKMMASLTTIMRQDSPPNKEDVVWNGKLDKDDYYSDLSGGGIGTRSFLARVFLYEMHNRQMRLIDPFPKSAEDVNEMVEAQTMRIRDTFLLVFGARFEAEVQEDRDNMVIEYVRPEDFYTEEREQTVRLGGLAIVAWAWTVGWFLRLQESVEVWEGVWVDPWDDEDERVVERDADEEENGDGEGEDQEEEDEEEESEDEDDDEEGEDEEEDDVGEGAVASRL